MKTTLLAFFSFVGILLHGQSDAATKAREHMFRALTVADGIFIKDLETNISHFPWEALAYMEEGSMLSMDDLNEAVPDYYYFQDNNLLQLKLIDAKNPEGFGTDLTIPYRIDGGVTILLINPKANKVEDSWDILYLDKNYLALDMGDIRVFFIHTIIKE
ncbi:hypothetical protein [Owenweeksia hongkongensis]|uniref:hypothetical protein n=1 Tax=Owenweeksia hongkongensis TaxID=253245 RepID=UPI003A8DD77E